MAYLHFDESKYQSYSYNGARPTVKDFQRELLRQTHVLLRAELENYSLITQDEGEYGIQEIRYIIVDHERKLVIIQT